MCIMLSGFAGAGKDTVAEYITENHKKFKQFALADPVRYVAMTAFGISKNNEKYFHERELKEKVIPNHRLSSREMCQIIGNEFRNIFYPEIWCENLKNRSIKNTDIVISDQRYANESDYFREIYDKVVCIRVERPSTDGVVGIKNHPSEAGDFIVEYILENNKDFDFLYSGIDGIMNEIL